MQDGVPDPCSGGWGYGGGLGSAIDGESCLAGQYPLLRPASNNQLILTIRDGLHNPRQIAS